MSEPYLGEIRMFGGNFAPSGWALCDGSLRSIAELEPLFTLIGTTYGGDGQNTFALPDLRGRLPVHHGAGPGLSTRVIGSSGGAEAVTLTQAQLPSHTHQARAASTSGTSTSPGAGYPAAVNSGGRYASALSGPVDQPMSAAAVAPAGGGQPHTNLQPFVCVTFIIALFGIFPPQE